MKTDDIISDLSNFCFFLMGLILSIFALYTSFAWQYEKHYLTHCIWQTAQNIHAKYKKLTQILS